MNDNNDPNTGFNTNPDTQMGTNPFTGDLKGEFSSDFGTNTNAVSQIFKSSSFSSENRKKFIAIGAAVLLLLGGIAFFLTDPSADDFADDFADEMKDDALPNDVEEADEEAFAQDPVEDGEGFVEQLGEQVQELAQEAMSSATSSTGGLAVISPENGASRAYDETAGPAEFSWEGPADRINFSRSPTMQPLLKSIPLNGATYFALERPYPGTWYWQVVNSDGGSEVRKFRVSKPVRRSFPVAQPRDGGSLAGEGGVISWQAGEKIARYSVELAPSGQGFTQPEHRFGTSGTSISLQGVQSGNYDIRVGAFSEVSGRWEWQYIKNVSVQ